MHSYGAGVETSVCVFQVERSAVRTSSGVETGNASPAVGFVTIQTTVETEAMSCLSPAVSQTHSSITVKPLQLLNGDFISLKCHNYAI